ncbi:hypothetical protein EVAR_63345_1 [Eumeta japonica]|uniref:Uncharacterized protein n=1 Tax=Eumeta variegata TaxID=151549 RepID=A0A4C1YUT8_EUMVA|nr:hypothetical protein EVAR_63345_1 [Eumeta japonica]
MQFILIISASVVSPRPTTISAALRQLSPCTVIAGGLLARIQRMMLPCLVALVAFGGVRLFGIVWWWLFCCRSVCPVGVGGSVKYAADVLECGWTEVDVSGFCAVLYCLTLICPGFVQIGIGTGKGIEITNRTKRKIESGDWREFEVENQDHAGIGAASKRPEGTGSANSAKVRKNPYGLPRRNNVIDECVAPGRGKIAKATY